MTSLYLSNWQLLRIFPMKKYEHASLDCWCWVSFWNFFQLEMDGSKKDLFGSISRKKKRDNESQPSTICSVDSVLNFACFWYKFNRIFQLWHWFYHFSFEITFGHNCMAKVGNTESGLDHVCTLLFIDNRHQYISKMPPKVFALRGSSFQWSFYVLTFLPSTTMLPCSAAV